MEILNMRTLHGWERTSFVLLHVYVLGVCGVVLGAFTVQFLGKEIPCPLCILQRMAMLLAAVGPMFIINRSSIHGSDSKSDLSTGFGMSILAALVGLFISGRQVLLHIIPGDPGYGGTVFGFHLYTWAFTFFSTILLASGITLVMSRYMTISTHVGRPRVASRLTAWVLGLVIAANAISVFFESGTTWFLPDDPTNYELIEEFNEFRRHRAAERLRHVSEGQLNLGTDDRLGFIDPEDSEVSVDQPVDSRTP